MLYFSKWKVALILGICLLGVIFAAPNMISPEVLKKIPFLPSKQINLGLDLQGGAHLLLQVDMDSVIKDRLDQEVDSVRGALRDAQVLYTALNRQGNSITVRVREPGDMAKAMTALKGIEGGSAITVLGSSSGQDFQIVQGTDNSITLTLTDAAIETRKRSVVEQSIEIVRRRIDEMGTKEPTIQRQGDDRILVEVPGLGDPQTLKDILGTTAKLSFHLVDATVSPADIANGRVPPSAEILPADPNTHTPNTEQQYAVQRTPLLTGDMLVDAKPTYQQGAPVVSFRLNSAGARRFGEVTEQNVGRPFAIVLDDKVISAPVIREPILGGSGVISGGFTVPEATNLAILLRAGALPAKLNIVQESTVGPGLGADSIRAGTNASIVGMILVVVYMVLAYGGFGMAANAALLVNLVLILAALTVLGATLTLPGIAGITLTVGMAVDANVLIYERIREEVRNGKTPLSALEAGFSRAYGTIIDANVTTLIAALLMFQFGSGPIKGFAVTLSIGVATSMFTAVTLTRLILATWIRRRRPKVLTI
jgi:protein-export membrane protein SecD